MSNHSYNYPRPALTVDSVLFAFKDDILQTLLIQRKKDPFAGSWAYPGGFVEDNETAEQASVRELWEETSVHGVELEQLFAETALNRDPRGWIVSVVFFACVHSEINVNAGDDASNAEWHPVNNAPSLVFGHEVFLKKALHKCRRQMLDNVFGIELLPDLFDLKKLYKLYLQLINIPEQVEKIVKRLIDYKVLIEVGGEWHFEKGRYKQVRETGFLR